MSRFMDLLGTTKDAIRLGIAGVRLKNSSGNLLVRNSADSADAQLTASKVNVSGDVIELNSDAAGTGADRLYTIQRPVTGMTGAVVLTLPIDDGTPNQVLQTDGGGILSWASSGGSTASSKKIDTTSLAFGTVSPLTMFSILTTDIVEQVQVIIDTAFNGTPSLSVGITGNTSKYLGAGEVDLTQPAGTVFEVAPGVIASLADAIIATYAAGGASVGAARIIVTFATPS